ncbi:MAG: glycosyltransferase family 39 protein [Pseudomonadota bacterium]
MTGTRRFDPLVTSLGLIAAITAWRALCLAFNQLDLFMDEAQYWLWGQELAFGTYSKPPLIGWIIRAFTEVGGNSEFWIRLPGPVLYGITSVLVAYLAVAVWQTPEAAWAGAAFAMLPGVALISLFISTDAALLTFVALALLALVRLSDTGGLVWAAVLGVAFGLGLMAKYAMGFTIGLAVVAWTFRWLNRPSPVEASLLAGLTLLIFAPNVWWNLQNGFITLTHTAENAGWAGIAWNWSGVAEFLGVQLLSFGPVFAVAYLRGLVRPGPRLWSMILFSATIFAAIAAQALIRKANANWVAPAFIAGAVLAVPWVVLYWGRLWLGLGLAVNAILAIALPLATVWPEAVAGLNALHRVEGVRALSEAAIEEAQRIGTTTILAEDRRVLADLVYRTEGTEMAVLAWPVTAVAQNHYQLTRPSTDGSEGALVVLVHRVPGCMKALEKIRDWPPEGAFRRDKPEFYRMIRPCRPSEP